MVFGNPYEFAISWDIVPDWSSATFSNGLISLYVAGKRIEGITGAAESLGVNLWEMKGFAYAHKKQCEETVPLGNMTDALVFLTNHTYPAINDHGSELSNNEEYLLSPIALTDHGQLVFLVQDKKFEYVIAGSSKGELYCSVKLSLGTYERLIDLAYEEFQKQHAQLHTLLSSKSL